MVHVGYHASHEQFSPRELLRYVRVAEAGGFQSVNSSDHFMPWSERQGNSGFSFAWLGAAMQVSSLPFGVVCAPGYRYHPAIVAQAIATLGEMFPGRFNVFLGSGEALNERITGERWPAKSERNARLEECAAIIRKLLQGETVTHHGRVVLENARLYTLADPVPALFGAAVTAQTAAFVASWADGLITVNRQPDDLREVVAAFNENGGQSKPKYLKVQLSFASSRDEALAGAYDQWRTNVFPGTVLGELWTPGQFDAAAEFVQPHQVMKMVHVLDDAERLRELILAYAEMGFERIFLHNVNRNQEFFIKHVGRALFHSNVQPVE